MNPHTAASPLDKEIGRLHRKMILMGSYCEMQLKNARNAFKWRDQDLAAEAVASVQELYRFKTKIEADILFFIASRQSGASDLRILISLLKTVFELEKIGDYAASISKRVLKRVPLNTQKTEDLILDMMDSCLSMFSSVMGAVLDMDGDQATAIWHRDHAVDEKFARTMTALSQGETDGSAHPPSDMVFIARSCERIGDHITHISEDIYYACKGKTYLSEGEWAKNPGSLLKSAPQTEI